MRQRADLALVARGLASTRERAKRLILEGQVLVDGVPLTRPAAKVGEEAQLAVAEPPRYVGRGGWKLEAALDHFALSPQGKCCLDIGASTGGFTDCLLQRHARLVQAIDVGQGQLAPSLRHDPRVVVREHFNARHMTPDDLKEPPELITIDVSFISLTKILPAAFGVLAPGGCIVALVKPQFELERADIGKGGIVRNQQDRLRAVEKIRSFVEHQGRGWRGMIDSPIAGGDGNREFLAWLE